MQDAATGRFVHLTLEQRFWSKVNKRGPIPAHCPELGRCWLWTGGTNHFGYGRIHSNDSESLMAHRLSWELHNGPIPKGKKLLHRCDIPRCVRPTHLFLGTLVTNIADKMSKNRQAKGEVIGSSKLSDPNVRAIFRLRKQGEHPPAIAAKFGVYPSTIRRILSGKTWKHLSLSRA